MFSRIVQGVSSALDLNIATLSGCVDVIVVRQSDNTFKSTPFHVRFGKTKLLKSRDREVQIKVNGQDTDLKMRLNEAGEAQFEEILKSANYEDTDYFNTLSSSNPLSKKTDVSAVIDNALTQSSKGTLSSVSSSNSVFNMDAHPRILQDCDESIDLPNTTSSVEYSLCYHLIPKDPHAEEQLLNEIFDSNIVNWLQLNSNPALWYHPWLLCRFDHQPPFFPGRVALPLIASWVAFRRPLTSVSINQLTCIQLEIQKEQDKNLFSWVLGSNEEICSAKPESPHNKEDPHTMSQNSDKNLYLPDRSFDQTFVHKSFCPTSRQLALLPLKPGKNTIAYHVNSSLQGSKSVQGFIYLWEPNEKIIVSDVDGTITRSDVLGQLMPIVGKDWSHRGVAELYTKCSRNRYKILYLTSRAIGQAASTRDYLFELKQDYGAQLPHGPLIMSPDRLFPSLKREIVERKPFVFKIAALRAIRDLFTNNYNPFYAGFGNRLTDYQAYLHIGIPEARILIIDTNGMFHRVNSRFTTTYEDLAQLTDYIFPPLPPDEIYGSSKLTYDEQFNDLYFWRMSYEKTIYDDEDRGTSLCDQLDEDNYKNIKVDHTLMELPECSVDAFHKYTLQSPKSLIQGLPEEQGPMKITEFDSPESHVDSSKPPSNKVNPGQTTH